MRKLFATQRNQILSRPDSVQLSDLYVQDLVWGRGRGVGGSVRGHLAMPSMQDPSSLS